MSIPEYRQREIAEGLAADWQVARGWDISGHDVREIAGELQQRIKAEEVEAEVRQRVKEFGDSLCSAESQCACDGGCQCWRRYVESVDQSAGRG